MAIGSDTSGKGVGLDLLQHEARKATQQRTVIKLKFLMLKVDKYVFAKIHNISNIIHKSSIFFFKEEMRRIVNLFQEMTNGIDDGR